MSEAIQHECARNDKGGRPIDDRRREVLGIHQVVRKPLVVRVVVGKHENKLLAINASGDIDII